tara:strand:- start:923 stop:1063 length:141 start_codon:yes stop_codon:yes gene_type:complete
LDWVYLILILALIGWSIQMLVAYRSQVNRIQQQIDVAMANQGEVSE